MTKFDRIPVAKGQKGAGKGGGSGSTPNVSADTLLTNSTWYFTDLISEGEIEGWADPDFPAKCIFFDGVPLQNEDGSFNFDGVQYWLRTGTPDQDPVPGFAAVKAEQPIGAKVEQAIPVTQTVTSADVDAVSVKVGTSILQRVEEDSGDVLRAWCSYRIDMQVDGGGWTEVLADAMHGKTTSGYQRAHRIELPAVRPVNIRLVRVSADSESEYLQNDLYFVSLTEIIDAKLRYPNAAYVAMAVPSKVVNGRIPTRTYLVDGMRCWVPSNYDPVARSYDETSPWDGTFVKAFTTNPAFFSYTLYVDNRWGLGRRIPAELVDKWSVYEIGKYCDGIVDGAPRFTINGVINSRESAYSWVTRLSGVWRGATYWGAGAVVPIQDAPADPVKLVTNANVKDGAFSYSGTALGARKTAAVISYRDKSDRYKLKPGAVHEDVAGIQRNGRREMQLSLPFCDNRAEALRAGVWAVDTNLTATETVSYWAGLDHAGIRPGNVVMISDKHKIQLRVGGRIAGISPDRLTVTLDAPVDILDGETYQLLATSDVGGIVENDVSMSAQSGTLTVTLASALTTDVLVGAVFALTASGIAPTQWRVLSNTEEDQFFKIVALQYDPEKYDRVEQGILATDPISHILPSGAGPSAPAPVSLAPYLKADPGSISKLRLLASWPPVADPFVVRYRVSLQPPDGAYAVVSETSEASLEITPERDDHGQYSVKVEALTALGEVSPAGTAQASWNGEMAALAAPENWTGAAGFDGIFLTGDTHSAPDFKAFRIYGATASSTTLVWLDDCTATTYSRRVPVGDLLTRYKVTAVNYNNDESEATDFIDVVPGGVDTNDLTAAAWDAISADATGIASTILNDFQTDTFTPAVGGLNANIEQLSAGQRSAERAADQISENVLWSLLNVQRTESLIRDAGIYVDQVDGNIRIAGIEQAEGKISEVEINLNAQSAAINLRATYAEVESIVAAAALDPSALPVFTDLQLRMSTAEIDIDALEGAITLKADTTTVSGIDARLVTAEADIDSLGAAIALTVNTSEFTGVETRLQSAEVTISALDVPAITQSVADTRYLHNQVDLAEVSTLEGLLELYQTRQALRADLAFASQDLRALVDEDRSAIAQLSIALGASIDGNAALIQAEQLARVDADGALASDITSLQAGAGTLAGDISVNATALSAIDVRVTTAEGGITSQASDITSLTTTVGGHTTTITEHSASIDGVLAEKTIQLDVNGHISGLVLRSEMDDEEAVIASAAFIADKFAIVGPGDTPQVPFVVYSTPQEVNGIEVPAGVYMENAFIKDLSAVVGTIGTLETSSSGQRAQLSDLGTRVFYENGVVAIELGLFG